MDTGIPERYRPVDSLACAAAYVSRDGVILQANDAFLALWRRSDSGAGRIDRQTLPLLFVQHDREAVRQTLAAPGRTRRVLGLGAVAGSGAPMLAEFLPICRESHGGLVWLVTLRPSQQAPEPSADLTSRAAVTAGIVHDLRTPVQVVLGWASLLRRKHHEPERIAHALTIIERNAELLMNMLEDLLERSRPSWVRASLQRQAVDLAELTKAEIAAVRPLADQNGVRLSIAVDSDGIIVEGFEIQLRRIVINLLGNALKFTPRGGAVECRLWQSGGWAGLVVRDDGPGIPGELLPRVFEPFVQEPGHLAHGNEGLGLGLAVVRQLVELHGGNVTAESAGDGGGATFTVLLPAVANPAAAERALRNGIPGAVA